MHTKNGNTPIHYEQSLLFSESFPLHLVILTVNHWVKIGRRVGNKEKAVLLFVLGMQCRSI